MMGASSTAVDIRSSNSYFQRLSLCETLQRTLALIALNIVVFAQLSFVTVGTFTTVWSVVQFLILKAFGLGPDDMNDPNVIVEHPGAFFTLSFSNIFVLFFTTAVGHGALVRAVAELYMHRLPSFRSCVKVGFHQFFSLFWASILVYFGSVIGALFFVLPGFYVMVNWSIVNPVIIIEGLGACAGMKRSWNLVSATSWCYVFGIWFIGVAMGIASQLIWLKIFAFNPYTFYGTIMSAIPGLIVTPIIAVSMTIMYMNLRIEKEGLNAEVFSHELRDGVAEAYGSIVDHDDAQDATEKKQLAATDVV